MKIRKVRKDKGTIRSPLTRRVIQLLPTMNDTMISREVGCSREWVRQVRKREGIPSIVEGERCSLLFTEEKLGDFIRDVTLTTTSTKMLCEKYGISYYNFFNILRVHKLKRPKEFDPWWKKRKYNIDTFKELLMQGKSKEEIMGEMDIHCLTVYWRLYHQVTGTPTRYNGVRVKPKVVALLKAGHSYSWICKELGCTKGWVALVKKELRNA